MAKRRLTLIVRHSFNDQAAFDEPQYTHATVEWLNKNGVSPCESYSMTKTKSICGNCPVKDQPKELVDDPRLEEWLRNHRNAKIRSHSTVSMITRSGWLSDDSSEISSTFPARTMVPNMPASRRKRYLYIDL